MFRKVSIVVVILIFPVVVYSNGPRDFDGYEKALNLVMRSCLSSTRVSYKIKGKFDLSILKKITLGGEIEGDAVFEANDIVSYLPGLKDELQQNEKDAIRGCINPILPDLLDEYGILKKKKS